MSNVPDAVWSWLGWGYVASGTIAMVWEYFARKEPKKGLDLLEYPALQIFGYFSLFATWLEHYPFKEK